MAEELQPELDQLFDKEKNPFTENQVRNLYIFPSEERFSVRAAAPDLMSRQKTKRVSLLWRL